MDGYLAEAFAEKKIGPENKTKIKLNNLSVFLTLLSINKSRAFVRRIKKAVLFEKCTFPAFLQINAVRVETSLR